MTNTAVQCVDRSVQKLEESALSTGESFNDWGGGGGCHNFVPVLKGNGPKIALPGDIFDQPSGKMN